MASTRLEGEEFVTDFGSSDPLGLFQFAALSSIVCEADTKPHQEIRTDKRVSRLSFFPDGAEMVLVFEDGTAVRKRVLDGRNVGTPLEASTIITSRDGRWLVGGWRDGKLTIWDRANMKGGTIHTTEHHSRVVTALDISPDSSKVASGAEDGSVIFWSRVSGKQIGDPIQPGAGAVACLQFSTAGDRLAGCHYAEDGAVYVWDVSNTQPTLLFKVAHTWVHKLRWSHDAKCIFAGSTSSMAVINASTGSATLHPFGFSDLASNGKFIVSFTSNVGIRFLDTTDYRDIGQTLPCSAFSLSQDDTLLATRPLHDVVGPLSIRNLQHLIPKFYTIATVSDFLHGFVPVLKVTQTELFCLQPFLDVDDAALVAWYDGRLQDAEAILSNDIIHRSSSHRAFAHRALVRARLEDWDASLDDARTSLRLRPTALAHIAKGIALSGKKEGARAKHEIDLALHECSSHERGLMLLIKHILVFKGGQHEDAIEGLISLTEVAADKRMHRFVLAYMHLLRGEEAMKSKNHYGAIKSFTSAQNVGPVGKVPQLNTIFLLFGWEYDPLWFSIHQQKCEALLAARRPKDAADLLIAISDKFEHEMTTDRQRVDWFDKKKLQCARVSEGLADLAVRTRRLDEAVLHYSAALANNPPFAERLFTKRSKAHLARESWEDALHDADEAIALSPLSPGALECREAALRSLEQHFAAFDLLNPEDTQTNESPDAKISSKTEHNAEIRTVFAETKATIDAAREKILRKCPFVVIDVETGRLCNASEWTQKFEESSLYKELATSGMVKEELVQLTVERFFAYVMFSHRWDEEHKEPTFQDLSGKSVWDLPPSPTINKLRKFLELVKKAGFRFAWSDTCCIDKTNRDSLAESITLMYTWYGGSALTIVFLANVPSPSRPGDLRISVWMTRGWTLQELLAPKMIQFYDADWNPYLNDPSPNHKDSLGIMQELAAVMSLDHRTLVDFTPDALGVREKLRLASTRTTTKEEDIAYCLIGIFSSDLRPHYGEGLAALGLLLQGVVSRSGEVTVLAWSGESSTFHSCLPSQISVYQQSPSIPSVPDDQMKNQVATLRSSVSMEEVANMYLKIIKLGSPRFADRRLSLPCIQFIVTELSMTAGGALRTRVKHTYKAKAPGLLPVTFHTAALLSTNLKPPGRLVLVHPWIRDLLGPVQPHDDWDDDPEADAPSASPPTPLVPSYSDLQATSVFVRLLQPVTALLLEKDTHHSYRRVATDVEIVIQLSPTFSSKDIYTGVLDIL